MDAQSVKDRNQETTAAASKQQLQQASINFSTQDAAAIKKETSSKLETAASKQETVASKQETAASKQETAS